MAKPSSIAATAEIAISVSPEQLLTLFGGAPINVIPAPGAGKMINLIRTVASLDAGTMPYDGYVFLSHGGSLTPTSSIVRLNSPSDIVYVVGNSRVEFPKADVDNKPLTLVADEAIVSGNGTLKVSVLYQLVDL